VFTDFNHQFIQAGISPLLQKQLEVLAKRNVNVSSSDNNENKGSRFVIIGQDRVEPLQALQDSGQEVIFSVDIYVITTRIMFVICVCSSYVSCYCYIFLCPSIIDFMLPDLCEYGQAKREEKTC
jgi:hypothetical protein